MKRMNMLYYGIRSVLCQNAEEPMSVTIYVRFLHI